MSLNNLSAFLSALGRLEDALAASEEALAIRRGLAAARPDAFRPDLATSLNNLSNRMSALGRREEALAAIEDAVAIQRDLVAASPDTFRPDLATSLNNLSNRLSALGRPEEALAAIEDAVAIHRNFTTITERLPPSDVVEFLSRYHTRMVEVIFAFGGTIDKFIGDAIMVTFGTPDPSDDDAERSVRAGLAMNATLAELNADRERGGLDKIRHGIGIHFGPVIAGNIGTEDRLEYTVIGDTVNVASRIQDACKSVGESFLISDAVKTHLPPDIQVRTLPEQYVKGRHAPVQIYAVEEQANSD